MIFRATFDTAPGRTLAGAYVRATLWYFLCMVLLWLLGVESIYGHPTPFYALYHPVFDSLFVPVAILGSLIFFSWWTRRALFHVSNYTLLLYTAPPILALLLAATWRDSRGGQGLFATLRHNLLLLWPHLPALMVFAAGLGTLLFLLRRRDWHTWEMNTRERRWFLFALWLFMVLFSLAIAMIRGGLDGITQAYARETYEYIGDIGKTASIRALFTRYTEIHEYLSMHAKVHPPGPIVLLWLPSYLLGRSALMLSLFTVLGGAAAVVPLFFWARRLLGEPAARTACVLYALVPSVVLFSATSTDILFTPITLSTLWLFERAIQRGSARDAMAAGLLYGLLSITSFSLLAIGAYFAFVGLWRCAHREWLRVVMVAAIMVTAVALFHGLLYLWSGFDILGTFRLAKQQFDLDQHHLDLITPRLPAWSFRLWNPLTWFYFAGIPISLLFLWRVWRPAPDVRARVIIFLLTLLALNLLYLARGEGERSALYIFPFLVLPAAHLLHQIGLRQQTLSLLLVTCGFLALQCWITEAYFYTYW